ncbi:MAG: phage portal protein [Chloroflexi bacterium]|nr:phage portal protein [Chloroflexota bacterium]
MGQVIVSETTLVDMSAGWWPTGVGYGSIRLYDQFNYDYATIYRTQPNVRTCVEFLARNLAQLGLHVYRRVSETDRVRERDHPLARVLSQPLPPWAKVTHYRLIEHLISDMGIYYNAFWLKQRADGQVIGLLRVPPVYMTVKGGLIPTAYEMRLGGELTTFAPEDVVHFRGYNSESAIEGLSPLETLRRVLAEEHAAADYREHFWANAARMGGIIERPKEAPDWSPEARERFKAEFKALYTGAENSGETAVLEEGMQWKQVTFNAQESEYLAGRKLTREECARAYHIPLPMVGILDHATFSNIKDQHKSLYQDTLAPWCAMIQEEIDLQLKPDFADSAGVYVEFNLKEKLRGSFEEQAQSYQSAVGAPWMTRNEARARENLPSMGSEGDELVTPLNVLTGGMASPRDAAPKADKNRTETPAAKADDDATEDADLAHLWRHRQHVKRWRELLERYFGRQAKAILTRIQAELLSIESAWDDEERWNRELADDLLPLYTLTAEAWAAWVADRYGVAVEASDERMQGWLRERARIAAESINATTREQVAAVLVGALTAGLATSEIREQVAHVFEVARGARAAEAATAGVTGAANFGATEAAKAGGLSRKTWRVNSRNPRDHHAALNGVTVALHERFPNGMLWPGDPVGGADNNANCQCSVVFG